MCGKPRIYLTITSGKTKKTYKINLKIRVILRFFQFCFIKILKLFI